MDEHESEISTVEEALERLAGRRALAIEMACSARTLVEGPAQNRHVRRNTMRLARAQARKVSAG